MTLPLTPSQGYAPDASPDTPGIFTDCINIIPDETGFLGAPTAVEAAIDTLAAECRGAAVITKLDGTRRIFAGTQTRLYELLSTSWTDRSAGGSAYTGSVDSRWSLAQFGDTTVASNLVDNMQASTTGAFAAISGAPKARIVTSLSNNFVMAFNTNDGTYGVSPDRWWCCAQNDQTSWPPSVATGAASGRLIGVEGAIAAARPLGDYVVAYKARATFLGQFVGAANGSWQFTMIAGAECGAVGQEAVCNIGGAHFIVGDDEFWIFDGTRPQPIGEGVVRDWFRANSSATYRYRTKATYDRQRNIVWVSFPSIASTGACDFTMAYHVGRKRWGRADFAIEAPLTYVSPALTIDGLDSRASTIDTLPAVPFDSPYWASGGRTYSAFNAAHKLVSFSGPTADSSWTSCDVGDDDELTDLGRMRVRFTSSPQAATATGLWKMNEGDELSTGASAPIWDGGFDVRQSARFHRVRLDMTGPHHETAYKVPTQPGGWR